MSLNKEHAKELAEMLAMDKYDTPYDMLPPDTQDSLLRLGSELADGGVFDIPGVANA